MAPPSGNRQLRSGNFSHPRQLQDNHFTQSPQYQEHVPHQYPSESDELPPIQDVTDGGAHVSVNVNANITTGSQNRQHVSQQVQQNTPDLVTSFIVNRMDYEGHNVPDELAFRARNIRVESQVADTLKRIGDEISNNTQLNDLIGKIEVTPNTAYQTFVRVAAQIFKDGSINWGRIVTLFYFAYKLALQVVDKMPLIDMIIGWVTKYVIEKLLNWIVAKGGWGAVREYFGSTTTQLVAVFFAGIFLSSLFWFYNKK